MSSNNPKLSALGKLTIGAESNFGEPASGGNTKYVKAVSVDLSGLEKAALVDEHQRQGDYRTAVTVGPATGTITTVHYLSGWSSSIPSTAPAMATPLATGGPSTLDGWMMLRAAIGSALGNIHVGGFANDVNTATSSTDAVNCTAGTGGTAFTTGQAVAFVDANGMGHVNYAKSVTSGTVVLLQTAKGTVKDPDGDAGTHNGILHGGWTAYQTTGPTYHELTTGCQGFTLTASGHDSDDAITASGCLPTNIAFSMPIGELPTMTITWGVSHWSEVGSGGLGGGALVAEDWANSSGVAFPLCEPFVTGWVTKGNSQANPMRVSSIECDLGVERPAIADPSFTSGIGGFGPIRRAPQVSYSVFRDFSEEVTDFLDQTGETYSFTLGTQPGKMVNICIPNGRVLEYPSRGDEDGAVTSSVTVAANYYDGDTGATPTDQSTPIDSDFRIAFC